MRPTNCASTLAAKCAVKWTAKCASTCAATRVINYAPTHTGAQAYRGSPFAQVRKLPSILERGLGRVLERVLVSVLVMGLVSACGGGGGGSSSGSSTNAGATSGQTTSQSNSQNSNQSNNQAQTVPANQTPTTQPEHVLSTLVLFSPGVRSQFADPELRISHLVNVANDVFENSGVDLLVTPVHVEEIAYPDDTNIEATLEALTLANHATLTAVPTLRATHKADIVVLIRPYANDGKCGYAWLGGHGANGDLTGFDQFAYAVVASNCADYVLAHEIGHLLGLAHSEREDSVEGTHSYSRGYGVDNSFTTIMASPAEYNATQLPTFSSPSLSCNGEPCGVTHTERNGADSVRTLEITVPQATAYLD